MLQVGGLPHVTGDTVSFIGGFVLSNAEDLTSAYVVANASGFRLSATALQPQYFATTASLSLNFGELYGPLPADTPAQGVSGPGTYRTAAPPLSAPPAQFMQRPADVQVAYWGPISLGMYAAAADALQQLQQSVPNSTDHTLSIVFGVLAGVFLIATAVLGVLLYRAMRSRSALETQMSVFPRATAVAHVQSNTSTAVSSPSQRPARQGRTSDLPV